MQGKKDYAVDATATANIRNEIPACLREAEFQAIDAQGQWAKLLMERLSHDKKPYFLARNK